MSSVLIEAPPRDLPAGAQASVSQTVEPIVPLVPVVPNPNSLIVPVRGVIPPVYASSLPSSLPAHAAHVASLAILPSSELEVRRHTDHYRPIIEKEGSVVYLDKTKKNDSYILRPNFRELHESDDPANHRSLNFITTVPPTLAQSFNNPPGSAVASVTSKRPKNTPSNAPPTDRLLFVRPPKRGLDERKALQQQEQKERIEDYESGGLKPRPIKSVAAILASAPGAKKPTHLRLGSMKNLAAAAVAMNRASAEDDKPSSFLSTPKPSTGHGGSLARFAKGLKLPSKSSAASAGSPLPILPPGDVDSEDEKEAEAAALVESPLVDEASLPEDGVDSGKQEAVIVANEGAACCICTSSDFVEPLISQCGHICCSECWITWLNENPEKQCPECDAPISLEELRHIALCPICSNIPTKPWTAPCRHACCKDCWETWLEENPVCPECSAPIDKAQLPK